MKKDFQTWWNDHFFRTDLPYYKTYRDLYNAGADLDYIRCHDQCIKMADSFDTPASGERTYLKKVRKQLHALLENKNNVSRVVECFGFVAALHSAVTIQEALRKDPSDPLFSRRDSSLVERCKQMAQEAGRITIKTIIEEFTGDRGITKGWPISMSQEFVNALSNIIKRLFSWVEQIPDFPEVGMESQPEFGAPGELLRKEIKKRGWILGPKESVLALGPIFMGCAGQKSHKTKKPDPYGTFFLLAVTEHLRERSGRPKHLLAARLLKNIRGQSLASGYQERSNAKSKVEKFKSDFADWKSRLRTVKKYYRLSLGHRTSRAL